MSALTPEETIRRLREALEPFTFPAHPDRFHSTDGGCTETIVCDSDVQRAREVLKPACPYCGTTEGLRQTAPPEAPYGPDYICEGCFTAQDDGPCFDDLPAA